MTSPEMRVINCYHKRTHSGMYPVTVTRIVTFPDTVARTGPSREGGGVGVEEGREGYGRRGGRDENLLTHCRMQHFTIYFQITCSIFRQAMRRYFVRMHAGHPIPPLRLITGARAGNGYKTRNMPIRGRIRTPNAVRVRTRGVSAGIRYESTDGKITSRKLCFTFVPVI